MNATEWSKGDEFVTKVGRLSGVIVGPCCPGGVIVRYGHVTTHEWLSDIEQSEPFPPKSRVVVRRAGLPARRGVVAFKLNALDRSPYFVEMDDGRSQGYYGADELELLPDDEPSQCDPGVLGLHLVDEWHDEAEAFAGVAAIRTSPPPPAIAPTTLDRMVHAALSSTLEPSEFWPVGWDKLSESARHQWRTAVTAALEVLWREVVR